jgi:hypothetical protein
MRGADGRSEALFSYVDLEDRVPAGHPLRVIRGIVNATLAELSPVFARLDAPLGRPSIPPAVRCPCRHDPLRKQPAKPRSGTHVTSSLDVKRTLDGHDAPHGMRDASAA